MRISDWSSDVCSSDLIKHSVAGSVGYLTEGSVALSWRWGRINTPWWAGPPDRVEYIAEPAPATGGSTHKLGVRELYVWGGNKAHARLYNSLLQGPYSDIAVQNGERQTYVGGSRGSVMV